MKLKPSFNFSLNSRIRRKCALTGKVEDGDSLIAVSSSNKVIIRSNESSLHIPGEVRALSTFPLPDGHDAIVIGTDAHLLVYDPFNNLTIFERPIPDGVNCLVVGTLATYDTLIMCGGNCAIWGFDLTGKDVYWTVTGDNVSSMCLVDYDGDGENELIVGSEDFEMRFFKNDLMREEVIESDTITNLVALKQRRIAYSLHNGTIGIYEGTNRIWRSKAKVNVVDIVAFPTDHCITTVWENGKVDVRLVDTGDVVARESFQGTVAAAFTSNIANNLNNSTELTLVFSDGKVRGMEVENVADTSEDVQDQLREYGQRKHNLLVELSNFEAEEERPSGNEEHNARIPATTTLDAIIEVNLERRQIEINLHTTNSIPIRGCVIMAEGIFDGESCICVPENSTSDKMLTPILPQKDNKVEVHLKTFVGHATSPIVHVFETSRVLPRFARFALLLGSTIKQLPAKAESLVEMTLEIRATRIYEWVLDNFLISEDKQELLDAEGDAVDLTFLRLEPLSAALLRVRYEQGQLTIEHDDMETSASIVQSLMEYLAVKNISSHAVFPHEIDYINTIIQEMESMYEVRDRLNTEISEKERMLKEILVRAEDALAIDHMQLARKYYTRLRNSERDVSQSHMLAANNHEKLISSLRKLHKVIEMASKLRVGEPSRAIVQSCREAISHDNLAILSKIIEFGSLS